MKTYKFCSIDFECYGNTPIQFGIFCIDQEGKEHKFKEMIRYSYADNVRPDWYVWRKLNKELTPSNIRRKGIDRVRAIKQVKDILDNSDEILAYGGPNEYKFLNNMFMKISFKDKEVLERYDILCVQALLRSSKEPALKVENFRLPTVLKDLKIEVDKSHDALDDAVNTYKVYKLVTKYVKYERTQKELYPRNEIKYEQESNRKKVTVTLDKDYFSGKRIHLVGFYYREGDLSKGFYKKILKEEFLKSGAIMKFNKGESDLSKYSVLTSKEYKWSKDNKVVNKYRTDCKELIYIEDLFDRKVIIVTKKEEIKEEIKE